MFGLSFEKLIVIGIIAVMIVGPTRLPVYAAKLAQFVKALTEMANNAKDRVTHELGPEFEDLDWKKLDPRQYDPRRIIREALLDDSGSTPIVRPSVSAENSTETSSSESEHEASSPESQLEPSGPDPQLEASAPEPELEAGRFDLELEVSGSGQKQGSVEHGN
jgi:sec-independent protein translocase protein TatB